MLHQSSIQTLNSLYYRSMGMGFFRFCWACVKRAFAGWFKRVEGLASSVSLLIGVGLLFWHPPASIEKAVSSVPNILFLGLFPAVILIRLIQAPYWLLRDERAARAAIEKLRQPALRLALPEPPVIQSISLKGTTSESLSGKRQTVITGWEMDVVALHCTNYGETAARGCRARLLEMIRTTPEGDSELRIVGTLELPWSKEDPEGSLSIDIAPAEQQCIWIGGVRSGGQTWLFRDRKRLPIEYQQLLGEVGTYRLLIQLDGDNIPPQQIQLEIVAGSGLEQVGGGILRGSAEVRLLAQGAPRIEE
ncbi:hypothetical protein FO470_06130 [Starkeya sp. 3C]|uniref:Uncharacterized protein n=2 Tax=Ancylobacter moscoviensis TaxID=2597768 RepID=A0ABY3DXB9_9HYPH|nr:hypothetical protein FO470_06130 [Ancylobacter moscoviensis]